MKKSASLCFSYRKKFYFCTRNRRNGGERERGVREFFESLKASKRKEVRRRRVAGRIRNTSVARESGRGAGPEKTEKNKKVNNTKKSLILAQDER